MATESTATGATKKRGGRLPSRFFGAVAGIWLLTASHPAVAQSRFVRITGLSDVNFGTISNFSVDAVRRQDVCVFSGAPGRGYNVLASGSGVGGAFTLQSGASTMAYEVQGADRPGQLVGFNLVPNIRQTGAISSAAQQQCSNGPAVTASLIVIIRAASLQAASGGNYSGTLTLVIAPE